MKIEKLAIRVNPGNPNHHLWNNNGTWFVHYTVLPTLSTSERVRKSLRTRRLYEARHKRDELFEKLAALAIKHRPTNDHTGRVPDVSRDHDNRKGARP